MYLHPTSFVTHEFTMQAAIVVILRHIEVTVHAAGFLGIDIRDKRVDEQRHLRLGHLQLLPVVVVDMHDTYMLHLA